MKKNLIAIAVGAVIAPMANANIIISEITEGSGSNKAIEIANVGSSSATLDGYTVDLAPNGGDWNSKILSLVLVMAVSSMKTLLYAERICLQVQLMMQVSLKL
ncbi:hypothetical protein BCU26_015830 [Vibrio splendidus]|uniref:hypothetical protein n=1 Tax=Vibrio splendidus TaxID=29497 RepID=UPI0039A46106